MIDTIDMAATKDIPGWPGYRADIDGSIWSCQRRGRIRGLSDQWHRMKPRAGTWGRLLVALFTPEGERKMCQVHRLILLTFVGECPEGMECCHGPDPDPANCRLDNLRWDTRLSNCADSEIQGTRPKGSRHGIAKLVEADIPEIRRLLAAKVPQSQIGKKFGVSQTAIHAINKGYTWSHVA